MTTETQHSKPMGHSKSCSKREVYCIVLSNTISTLPQETWKISNNLSLHLKQLEKEQTKPKVSRRKEIRDQSRNKWNRDKENNRKDQWNEKLVLWKYHKIDNSLARLIKKKRERAQINKIRNEKEVTTDIMEI